MSVLALLKHALASFTLGAPTIDLSSLKDIVVDVGQDIVQKALFKGEPPPTVSWSLNNAASKDVEECKIDTTESASVIRIKNARRSYCGTMVIELRNRAGADKATAKVTVLGEA